MAAADRIMSVCQKRTSRTNSATIWRIWSDVAIHWCENNQAGANGFNRVLPNTSFNTTVAHARSEDELSWKLRREEVALCDG